MMQTFYASTVLKEKGKLTLDHLPFAKGDLVQVFVSDTKPLVNERDPLRGTVVKYERPTEPVAVEEWEASK